MLLIQLLFSYLFNSSVLPKNIDVPIFANDRPHDLLQHTFRDILRKMKLPSIVERNTILKIKPEYDSPYTCSSIREPTGFAVRMTPLVRVKTLKSASAKLESMLDPRSLKSFFDLSRPTVQRMVADISYYSPERTEFILAHELAHIKNGDFDVFNQLKQAFMATWSRDEFVRMCHEHEYKADETAVAVLGARGAIGAIEHLAKTHKLHVMTHKRMLALGMTAMADATIRSRFDTHPCSLKRAQRVCEAAKAFGLSEAELVASAVRVGTMPGCKPGWTDPVTIADLFKD